MININKRKLKVYEVWDRNCHPIPQVRFQGKWLRSFGFEIGDELDVFCENRKLVITIREKQ